MVFTKNPQKHLAVFSPETVNIKILANLTANTKIMGKQHLTLNPIQTLINPSFLLNIVSFFNDIIPCYYINWSEFLGFLLLRKIVSLHCKRYDTSFNVFACWSDG